MLIDNKNMSTFWWKIHIFAIHILIANLTCITGLELYNNTKLSKANTHMTLIQTFFKVLTYHYITIVS